MRSWAEPLLRRRDDIAGVDGRKYGEDQWMLGVGARVSGNAAYQKGLREVVG